MFWRVAKHKFPVDIIAFKYYVFASATGWLDLLRSSYKEVTQKQPNIVSIRLYNGSKCYIDISVYLMDFREKH